MRFESDVSTMMARSVRLDVGRPDYLGPLFGIVSDKLTEVSGRTCKWNSAQLGKACLQHRIGEAGVDLFTQLVDNLLRRIFRRSDAVPIARFEAWHEIGHGWNVSDRIQSHRGGDCERKQLFCSN